MANLSQRFTGRPAIEAWRMGISLWSIEPLLVLCDGALVVLASVVGGAGYQRVFHGTYGDVGVYIGIGLVASLIYAFAAWLLGLYRLPVVLASRRDYWRIAICWLFAITLLTLLLFLLKL